MLYLFSFIVVILFRCYIDLLVCMYHYILYLSKSLAFIYSIAKTNRDQRGVSLISFSADYPFMFCYLLIMRVVIRSFFFYCSSK